MTQFEAKLTCSGCGNPNIKNVINSVEKWGSPVDEGWNMMIYCDTYTVNVYNFLFQNKKDSHTSFLLNEIYSCILW